MSNLLNQSKTPQALADKLEKYVGGFETYGEEERALTTSWFVPSALVKGESTPGKVALVRFQKSRLGT